MQRYERDELLLYASATSGLCYKESQNDQCPQASEGHLVQPTQSRTMHRQLLNISKDADPTALLGHLYQLSVTFTVEKYLLAFRHNLLCFGFCSLPLVFSRILLSWATLRRM